MSLLQTFRLISLGGLLIASSLGYSHSEPNKSLYVSNAGKDRGFCDNPVRPCKTIRYAVQKANKGDKVLVASGKYEISSTEELFYLKSEIVPVLAGFNRFDHFQSQSPNVNKTFLAGVPADMVPALREKGFHIIADGKATGRNPELAKRLESYAILNKMQSAEPCTSGTAGGFACENIDLVAHIPLNQFSTSPSSGSDIWGHVDLNSGAEYAIMGVTNGVAVFDLSDPENPQEVGTISGRSSTWRDIKVYQYFDDSLNAWQAYAYATVEAAEGVTIIDLNNLPESISLVGREDDVDTAHNVYISNVDHALNIKLDGTEPKLQLVGANRLSGSFHSYSLANPETLTVEGNQSSFNGYTHDGASLTITDDRKDTGCFNGGSYCSVFIDFNEKEMLLWDITNPADTRELSNTTYDDVSNSNKYVHSGWVTEDHRYILLHDEFDEYRGGLNSTVRIFQIDDLRSPVQVGQWTGPTRAIDHNGFVRGNRYYMSNYERGLTILDITDPSDPVAVGYFDTFTPSDNDSFNGAWGTYPFLPSGLILVSDINSGLYIVRDKTKEQVQGSASFAARELSFQRGSEATVSVRRVNSGAGASTVDVAYEVISGSAVQGNDFSLANGRLEWVGDDYSNKSISFTVAEDNSGNQSTESFFIRLFDPSNGLTLGEHSYLTVSLVGEPQAGTVEFRSSETEQVETTSVIEITVERVGGASGEGSVNYSTVSGTAVAGSDFEAVAGTLSWADGDSSEKSIQISLLDDEDDEETETFTVSLSGESGVSLGSNSEIQVSILDDDSNTAPEVTAQEDFEVNTGQTSSLTATASDAEGDTLTVLWTQVSGSSVTISNETDLQAEFVAPENETTLVFEVEVTDSKGAVNSDQVSVDVIAPQSDSSGGASGGLLIIGGLLLLMGRRKRA